MKLSAAIRIISDPDLLPDYVSIAEQLINDFVGQYEEIYGLEHCVFNTHLLTHLVQDCRRYGVVDNFSSFEFESFLFGVKLMKKSHKNPIVEIFNRAQEKLNNTFYDLEDKQCLNSLKWSYSHLKYNNIKLDNDRNNCWFISKELDIFRVLYFFCSNNTIYSHCYKVKNLQPLLTSPMHPFNSKFINIYKSDNEYLVVNVEIINCYWRKVFYYNENVDNHYIAMTH